MRREYDPDVRVIERLGWRGCDGGVALAESTETAVEDCFIIDIRIEPKTGSYIEVIDLLRDGESLLPAGHDQVPATDNRAYLIGAWRARDPDHLGVHRIPLRSRLPGIKIPLGPGDADVPIDVQEILDQCYRKGGYDDINDRVRPVPPLDPEAAA